MAFSLDNIFSSNEAAWGSVPAAPKSGGWGGQLFDFGSDLLGDYLSIKKEQLLLGSQNKLLEAEQKQKSLLGVIETDTPNANATTYTPAQLAAMMGSGSGSGFSLNSNVVLMALLGVGVWMAVKK
jgi:hypothetical protein